MKLRNPANERFIQAKIIIKKTSEGSERAAFNTGTAIP